MRAITRPAAVIACLSILVAGGRPAFGGTPLVAVGPRVSVYGANLSELSLVRWAVSRYAAARLELPVLRVYFNDDRTACAGNVALYGAGRIDMCAGLLINLTTRHTMLHEMAHAWSEGTLTPEEQQRFLDLRGLESWNAGAVPWQTRGWEQTADIVAWGIGDGVILPTIPRNDPPSLVAAFEMLTGRAPLVTSGTGSAPLPA